MEGKKEIMKRTKKKRTSVEGEERQEKRKSGKRNKGSVEGNRKKEIMKESTKKKEEGNKGGNENRAREIKLNTINYFKL